MHAEVEPLRLAHRVDVVLNLACAAATGKQRNQLKAVRTTSERQQVTAKTGGGKQKPGFSHLKIVLERTDLDRARQIAALEAAK